MPNNYSLKSADTLRGVADSDQVEVKVISVNGKKQDDPGDPDGTGDTPHTEEHDAGSGKENEDDNKVVKMVGVMEVFRFADRKDRLFILAGTIGSVVQGAAFPLMFIVFGNMSDAFIGDSKFTKWLDMFLGNISDDLDKYNMTLNFTREEAISDPSLLDPLFEALNLTWMKDEMVGTVTGDFLDTITEFAVYYCIIGLVVLVFGYIQVAFWMAASYRQTQKIRTRLFHAILKQEIGWFDTHEVGELNTRLADDVNKIQEGIGDRFAMFFQNICHFITSFIVGFVYGWKLTLVIIAISPLLAVAGGFMAKILATMTNKELKSYAKAGAVAEEVISSVRTVMAFGGQQKEAERYNSNLRDARAFGIRKGLIMGLGTGTTFLLMFSAFSLAFWYGSKLVREEPSYTGGNILVVFFSILTGAFAIGKAAPGLQDFATARGAAYTIFGIIDNEPSIDSSSEEGLRPNNVIGNVEFRNVVFTYPSRPDVTVLQGLNLQLNVGQTMALVGSSGCGKSTTVQLLQRFYDPDEGQVLIDGVDIRKMNVKWLRQNIGVVSQEPILFGTTIAENIRYGRDDVSNSEIEEAAGKANAHGFIIKLPDRYNTLVGERGAQLSGGQKQRIAIARALVRDPKILLLDEATSALDTESEASVQAALDKARMGRTTLVIAHRLSTIRTADQIAGIRDGKVVEMGSHDDLMQKEGVYCSLVTTQSQADMTEQQHEGYDSFDMAKSGDADSAVHLSEGRGRKRRTSVNSFTDKHMERNFSVSIKVAEDEEDLPDAPIKRIIRLNASEWLYIVVGIIAAILAGAVQPTFAIVFASILGAFSEVDPEKQKQQTTLYCLLFLAIGAVSGLSAFFKNYMFAQSGERLTKRLREMTFQALLRQEAAYFDDHKNNTGALTTRLATDASAVQGATGSQLGTVAQSVAGIRVGVIIGFIFSWKLALLILAFAPFMVASGFVRMRVMMGHRNVEREALEGAGKVATECIENIRTVATLTKEEKFYQDYYGLTEEHYKKNMKRSHLSGLSYGVAQCIAFFAYAACFRFGAYLIREDGLKFEDMFKVFFAIAFSAMSVGHVTSFAPDVSKAKHSAARLFALFDRFPAIDSSSEDGTKPTASQGEIEFKGVEFNYPTRPDVQVLRGLDVSVKPGQRLALVGSSGCGKSTTVQLIERFYDPLRGHVTLDGHDICDLNIQWLRSQIGIVSQEPILFDSSIRDNIAYGDNSREVPMDEIIGAARMANIHSFIEDLPFGYDTNVGNKGTQLSGGQKQRVAIARALVRNPKILLLDEATSALDTESEKVVQEALDKAQEGRTCIVIAHRLFTVQNADCIAVIHRGKVMELGTHSQLMQQQGLYYKLNKVQVRQKTE